MIGKITKINAGNYYIDYQSKIYKPRGLFRHHDITPLVGDKVKYNSDGVITNLLPRRNYLIRPKVANIDQVVVVTSLNEPKFGRFLLNKTLLMIENLQITPVLFFTKQDISTSSPLEEYAKQGYEVYSFSNYNNEQINKLKDVFKNKLTVLMGQTGVGKSTTINKLFNINLKTQEISKALGRGKHTTRVVEIFKFDTSEIIDTPGFSSLEHNVPLDEIARSYFDFDKFSKDCKFRNCFHYQEINCNIKKMVEKNIISKSRYEDYLRILKELLSEK